MSKSLGIDALIEKIDILVSERDLAFFEATQQIKELESCVELLSGKPYSEYIADFRFDDESPNHIRSSQEEI